MNEWTKESPTELGWYWWRFDGNLSVVEMYKHPAYPELRARLIHRDSTACHWTGEWWSERIQEPVSTGQTTK